MSALMVLMWALQLLARSAASLPIELVLGSQPGIAATVEVFVGAGSGVSSTPAASDAFETARLDECMSDAATKLASVLAYGEWHMVDGRDERGALEPQLAGLTRVGVSVVSTFVQGIFRGLQILTAIEEQPGLKLVPARTPQDFIVVDRVQRPSPD
jgi:hypothetical protein